MIAGQYDHILVDEMQDTNPIQWLILDGLRDDARLFCVGDDAQSIYAFRGADFENVHSFGNGSRAPDHAPAHELPQHAAILDLANWLLAQSPLEVRNDTGIGARNRAEADSRSNSTTAPTKPPGSWRTSWNGSNRGAKLKVMMVLVRAAWMTRDLEAALIETPSTMSSSAAPSDADSPREGSCGPAEGGDFAARRTGLEPLPAVLRPDRRRHGQSP